MNNIPSHVPANFIIKSTGIKKPTFYQRVKLRDIKYIEPHNQRLYSTNSWNAKCPDMKLGIDK